MSVETSESKTDSSTQSVRWKECLGTAIRYYNSQLDTEIENNPEGYNTARDYFSGRGWTDEFSPTCLGTHQREPRTV